MISEFDLLPLLVALFGGGGLATVVGLFVSRRKVWAEARSVEIKGELAIVGAANDLVEMLRNEVGRLQERVAMLEERMSEVREENIVLRSEISRVTSENGMLRSRLELVEKEGIERVDH